MSVNPFDNVMRSRAAFDAGHHNTDVVNGLNQARFDSYTDGGQPPISYGGRDQGLVQKVAAPPLSLDFTTKTDSQINLAGILKARHTRAEALDLGGSDVAPAEQTKAPETVALRAPESKTLHGDRLDSNNSDGHHLNVTIVEARAPETLHVPALDLEKQNSETYARKSDNATFVKRTPALSFAEFSTLNNADMAKFQDANYDLSIKHTDKGSVFKHTYTAKDFSTCTLSNDGESIHASVTDAYARKQFEESVTDGKSTVTRYSYDDSGARRAMIPCVKEVSSPDGIKVFLYDKFGKVIQA